MNPTKYLKASDGTGPAVLAHVATARAALDTTLEVDSVDNWPDEGVAASGVLLPSGFIDEDTLTEFRFHLSGGDIVIDEISPGFTDVGNEDTEVVIVKQTTDWADIVAEAFRTMMPSGVINPYAGVAAPDGWLLCYGQAVSRDTYADLFAAISTTYGVGDGSTTFNLPDLRGRVVAGQDDMGGSSANRLTGLAGGVNGDTLGADGGAESHVLTTAEMPSHRHNLGTAVAGSNSNSNLGVIGDAGGDNRQSSLTGGGGAHNNVQPTLILNYIIKA